jgi:hypothetical protein
MSGAAMGEFQGYQLALTGMEKNPMDQVSAITSFTIVS